MNLIILHPDNRQVLTFSGVKDQDGALVETLNLSLEIRDRAGNRLGDAVPMAAVAGTPGTFRAVVDVVRGTHADAASVVVTGTWANAPTFLRFPAAMSDRTMKVD